MYNQKIIDPNSIDRDELPDDIQIIKYNGIIDNIKKWIEQQKELEKAYKT